MIVSHNELVTVVTKAFTGMRKNSGEADLIANMVADLQMIGLKGVTHFNQAARYLAEEDDAPITGMVFDGEKVKVDLRNNSLICHLPVIIDFALEAMIKTKTLSIEISNCHNRWLAFGELVKLATKGISCRAEWDNGQPTQRYLCILNKGNVTPEVYSLSPEHTDHIQHQNIQLTLSTKNFKKENLSKDYKLYMDAQYLHEVQQKMWQSGIEVDDNDWKVLQKLAKAILVENSELSIQGAGEK